MRDCTAFWSRVMDFRVCRSFRIVLRVTCRHWVGWCCENRCSWDKVPVVWWGGCCAKLCWIVDFGGIRASWSVRGILSIDESKESPISESFSPIMEVRWRLIDCRWVDPFGGVISKIGRGQKVGLNGKEYISGLTNWGGTTFRDGTGKFWRVHSCQRLSQKVISHAVKIGFNL